MAPAKGTVYTIFPGEEFVPFPLCCSWKRLTPSLPVPFPQTHSREKCPIPAPPTLRKDVSTLRNNSRPFFDVTENLKVLVAESLSGWERETGWRDQRPCLSPFQFCLFLPLSFPRDSQTFPGWFLWVNQLIKIQGRFGFLLYKDDRGLDENSIF